MKLPDTNLWLALALDIHPHQQLASDWLSTQRNSESVAFWRNLSSRVTASPKLWMDAYLAAFAIQANCESVTFDAGFRQFAGLRLELLAIP